jgi:transglutaminase-like putative cysteine protease
MFLHVFHRTRYLYRLPVSDSHNEVRLRPATTDEKRLPFFLLAVQPPVRLRHFRDEHFNYVHWFDIPEPHDELVIEAESRITTTSQFADGLPTDIPFEALRGLHDESLRPFTGDSRYVAVEPEVWRLAVDARDGRRGVFETARALMEAVFRGWEYDPAATDASTHMRAAFTSRRGVCQDFAHIMIGLCRSLGIPARYVSGYLFAGRGAQASHAWCEIHLPGQGWFGLDPTNNLLADDLYVKIATGRDYQDAAPVRGEFRGPPGATAALEVRVEIQES